MCHQLHSVWAVGQLKLKSEKWNPVKLWSGKLDFRQEKKSASALSSLPCHLPAGFLHFRGDEHLSIEIFPKQSFLALTMSWGRIWGRRFIVFYRHVLFLSSTEPVLPSHGPFPISFLLITFYFPTEAGQIPQAFYGNVHRQACTLKPEQPHRIGKLVKREQELEEESQASLQWGLQGGKGDFSVPGAGQAACIEGHTPGLAALKGTILSAGHSGLGNVVLCGNI